MKIKSKKNEINEIMKPIIKAISEYFINYLEENFSGYDEEKQIIYVDNFKYNNGKLAFTNENDINFLFLNRYHNCKFNEEERKFEFDYKSTYSSLRKLNFTLSQVFDDVIGSGFINDIKNYVINSLTIDELKEIRNKLYNLLYEGRGKYFTIRDTKFVFYNNIAEYSLLDTIIYYIDVKTVDFFGEVYTPRNYSFESNENKIFDEIKSLYDLAMHFFEYYVLKEDVLSIIEENIEREKNRLDIQLELFKNS